MANLSDKIAPSGVLTPSSSIKNLSDVSSGMSPTDGQVLTYDTTNGWQAETAASGSSTVDYQEFTSSGTWTKPAAATSGDQVIVQVVAAGGASYLGYYPCGGGGGGGAVLTFDDVDDFASSETVVVGAGGTGAGGHSSFGTSGNINYIKAYGGGAAGYQSGGVGGHVTLGVDVSSVTSPYRVSNLGADDSFVGGDGGYIVNGSPVHVGGQHSVFGGGGGGAGSYTTNNTQGTGGASYRAGGGGSGTAVTTGGAGQHGRFPGGGGGAGSRSGGTRGNGANGVVRVWVIREV